MTRIRPEASTTMMGMRTASFSSNTVAGLPLSDALTVRGIEVQTASLVKGALPL